MPLKLVMSVHPQGAVDIDARAPAFQIERAPRVHGLTKASGRAEAHVKARIEKNQIDATLSADVRSFALGQVKLAQGHVSGTARGPLGQPDKIAINAKIDGQRLVTQGMSFVGSPRAPPDRWLDPA